MHSSMNAFRTGTKKLAPLTSVCLAAAAHATALAEQAKVSPATASQVMTELEKLD